MTNVTEITGAEVVDGTRYHVFTDKGVYLLDIAHTYTYNGGSVPSFDTVEAAVEYFNEN